MRLVPDEVWRWLLILNAILVEVGVVSFQGGVIAMLLCVGGIAARRGPK